MRGKFWGLGALAAVAVLSMSSISTAQAAPIGPAAAAPQSVGSLATNIHCRVYRHCHRRCWWRRGVRRCGRYCHRCG
jgi:hypothetical protein